MVKQHTLIYLYNLAVLTICSCLNVGSFLVVPGLFLSDNFTGNIVLEYVFGAIDGVISAALAYGILYFFDIDYLYDEFDYIKKCNLFKYTLALIPYYIIVIVMVTLSALMFNKTFDVPVIFKSIHISGIPVVIGTLTTSSILISIIRFIRVCPRLCPKCLSINSYEVIKNLDKRDDSWTEKKTVDIHGEVAGIYDKDNNKVGSVCGRTGSIDYSRHVSSHYRKDLIKCNCCGREKIREKTDYYNGLWG